MFVKNAELSPTFYPQIGEIAANVSVTVTKLKLSRAWFIHEFEYVCVCVCVCVKERYSSCDESHRTTPTLLMFHA
jgi:hypothetical protein